MAMTLRTRTKPVGAKCRAKYHAAGACLLTLLVALTTSVRAELKLPAIFSDNMVLQRNIAVPVWGWADPNSTVTVSFAGQTKTATADATGKWTLKLDALQAGGPHEMKVERKGGESVSRANILVGEVWVCSGQSNMEWTLKRLKAGPELASKANNPKIRLFTVQKKIAETPQTDVVGKWSECTPESAIDFSAVAYFFGRDLQENLNVPIGLIHTSWGGTSLYLWMREDVMAADPALAGYIEASKKQAETYPARLEQYKQQVEKLKAEGKPVPASLRQPGPAMTPACLYNGMIAPLIPYAVGGAIWYQGESNANPGQVGMYRKHLAQMIEHWRKDWNSGEFPFMIVQLANFEPNDATKEVWAFLREAQAQVAQSVPKTGLAVAIDVGEAKDIHPQDKETVGKRLAKAALNIAYGKENLASGPIYDSMKVEDNKVRLSFKSVGDGLSAKGELKGFTIAGDDKFFVPAHAKIEGKQVVVWSERVGKPAAVRYGWANNPEATLYNQEELPAVPFRTDTWPREVTASQPK